MLIFANFQLRAIVTSVAMAVLVCACASQQRASPLINPNGRATTALVEGWRFQFGDAPANVVNPAFDDAAWREVDIPHTWNRLGSYSLDRSAAANAVQGVGWYRLEIEGVRPSPERRYFLQFDGVGAIADVWVNGVHAGRHAGAFSRFRFDVTEALRPFGPQSVVVRADNSTPAAGSTTEHVIPLQGDFFVHGGLYRGVALIEAPLAHIDLLDHGGPGIYARAIRIDKDSAEVAVLARLRNSAANAARLDLAIEIRDADGRLAAEMHAPVSIAAGAAATDRQRLTILSPRLWNGRAAPHLYRLTVALRERGRVIDRVSETFGLRSFRIDPEEGFFLNGRHMPLRGVSRHQDWLDRGWVLTREDHARDMALIAEMGANTVRFAHYQHAKDWFEEADRTGMIVWAEIPFVNKVSFGDAPASPELIANAREQLIELIRQNYNHPSVVVWGLGNEVDIDLAFGSLGPRADARPLLRELHALARAEDLDRQTVIADCCEDTPSEKIEGLPVLAGSSDLMGYNRYFGWYYGGVDDLGPHLDALHRKHPDIPISISEYGAGGALSQHTDNPEGGPIVPWGRPHPEEFQSWVHEQSWPQLAERRYLWANWIWNMFDFSSNIRQEGDATDINDKGLVSFDREVRKDVFYFYKAHWGAEPMVHITGRRYVERAYPVTDVRVYSNAQSVSIELNGRPVGEAPCVARICVLRDVALAPGANTVRATAGYADCEDCGTADVIDTFVSDVVEWNATGAALGLAINVGDLAGFMGEDSRRVGSDNWFSGGTPKRLRASLAQRVSGAGDPRFWSGYREGAFSYAIPVPDGRWRVTLLFLEPDENRASPRRFDVSINGRRVLRDFNPAPAGDALKAVQHSFVVTVRDGRLNLNLGAPGQAAVLSGIVLRPLDSAIRR